MLRSILIFLLAVLIAFGSTFALYQDEVTDMIGMIKGETPDEKPDGPSKPDDGPVAVSMEIDTTGAKTVYNFGEEFSTEGLKITVTMSDGTVKEVNPDECKITPPDTTKAGSRVVRVVYGSASARYEVTVNAKVYPSISSTSLVDITEKNDSVPYRVEAELIDMATPGVVKAEGFDSFVATAPEGAAITSGEQYLTGFGVKWNYFGFTFTAAEKYEDTIIVLRVANATGKDIDAGAVKMYLNMTQDENGSPTGEIPLDGYIIKADGACGWYDIVLRHITIPEGTNTLTFEMQDDKVFDLDYVDFYVGMRYINSVVEIQQDTSIIVKDLETLDTEKAFTRQDVADAHGLKPGQLFVEPTKDVPGKTTSGGTAVGAIGKGSQMSTTIRLSQDATVLIKFKASSVGRGAYNVKDNWNFYIDGVKLNTVESVNIEGGDPSQGLWWDWIYTNVGAINLSAGDHFFLLEVHATDCNVDTVEFEVISFGSFDESGANLEDMIVSCTNLCPVCGKCLDTGCADDAHAEKCQGHASEDFKITVEAEDFTAEDVKTRPDFIAAGILQAGQFGSEAGNGETCIMGFLEGSVFSFDVTLDRAMDLELFLVGATDAADYDVASKLSLSINGNPLTLSSGSLTGSGATPYWDWQTVSLCTGTLEAGTYTFTLTVLEGHPNLEKVFFVEAEGEPTPPPAHECESVCPECGKCLDAECTESACADKCQGHAPVVVTPDVTISDASDSYKVEAENISLDTLVPQAGFEKPAIESFAGGKGLGGIGPGGYQSFVVKAEKDATVALKIAFAKYEGGSILTYIPAITVNGEALTLTDGQIAPGTAENQWWNVSNVQVATLTLEAGKTYTIKVSVNSGNLDGYVLEVVTAPAHECESICSACGKCTDSECTEAACAAKCAGHHVDATISGDGDVTLEAENWHYADDAIVTRPDFAPSIGQGNLKSESGNGATCIFAFTAGTKFVINVNAASAMEVDLLLRGATDAQGYEAATKLAVTLNGQPVSGAFGSLTGSGSTPYWDWQTVGLGRLNLVEGINEITITVLDGHPNIDLIKFAPVKDNAPVATPDATPDVTVATTGETKLELETLNLSKSTIVLRGDLIDAGFTAPGNSDGRIWGMADGTTIRLYVKADAPCTLKLSLGGFGTAMSNFTYTFGGVNMNAEGNYGSGSTAAGLIGNIEITEAGVYLFEFTTGGGVDLDYLTFEVQ